MNDPAFRHLLIAYLVVVNVVAFIVYGIDKRKAKRSQWRISEATLLLLAAIGGSLGAWLAMKAFHHKTLHKRFSIGVPLMLVAQVALLTLTSCRTKLVEIEGRSPHEQLLEHSPSVFLLMYDARVGKEPLMKAIKEYGAEVIYDYHTINGMALKKPADKSLEETMRYFKAVEGVLTVEYDHIYHITDPVARPVLSDSI